MKMVKKTLALVLSLVLLFSATPLGTFTVNAATYTYNPDAAISYAKAHYNDGKGLCAEFVSDCLKAGGFTAVYNVNARNLGRQLQGYGTKITCSGWSSSSCLKASMFNGTLSKGDVIVWENVSGSSSSGHVMLYSGKTNSKGQILVYAHNSAKNEDVIMPSSSASTVYAIHLTSTTENNYTYSFNFNANGGTLGSSGAFSVNYGEQFQILNTTCTRSGYTWGGWNVKRNNDNKWYVDGQGWRTESEISNNGYIKKLYPNYKTVTLDNSWTGGITGNGSYTFYAVWYKARDSKVKAFFSPYGKGVDHITAMNASSSSGYAQNYVYAWYVLYDENTGDLLNTYTDLNYNVCMRITKPNGESYEDTNYQNADANWVGFTPVMSGEYTITITVTGGASGSYSTTYNVSYDTELIASTNSVSLNLNGTNAKTVEFTPSGYYPGSKGYTANLDSSIASVTEHYWSGEKFYFTIKGNKVGEAPLTVKLYENYTGNKNVVATITIPVTVTANTYTISYNANGGSGAPTSQTKYYGTDITLSSTEPVGKAYTVTFDGNGGSASSTTKTYTQSFSGWNTNKSGTGVSYSPSSTFSSNLDVTLYAQWNNPTFSATTAKRDGYYFLGWYDSKSVDSAGLPTGKKYTSTTKISSNITLYAMWGKTANLLFGDYNLDGEITFIQDVSALSNLINGLITTDYTEYEVMFRCDLNRDGELDQTDVLTINKLRLGEITQFDLPSFEKVIIGEYPQTDFRYGEELDTDYLSIVMVFENGAAYKIEDNYIISGYDPYKIGTQTLTVNYYQYYTTYTVTVHPPEYSVKLDANGGTVKYSGYIFTYGEEMGTLVTPERDGYTFLGWTFEENGTNYVKPTDIYSYMSNKTLYAQWTINSYTVSYNANGGSNAPTDQTKAHGTTLTLSTNIPYRSGYTFNGWATSNTATSATYQPGGTYSSDANVTLYAVWSKIPTYTISYNANGGTGAPVDQIKAHNVSLTLSSVKPTRAGYKFMGWSTTSTATISSYQPGSTFTANENTTLYAIWSKDDTTKPVVTIAVSHKIATGQTVSLELTDDTGLASYYFGTSSSPSDSAFVEMTTTTSQTISKTVSNEGTYYVFAKDTSGNVSEKQEIVFCKTILNANGGSVTPEYIITRRGHWIALPTPTQEGSTFVGWGTSSTATSGVTTVTPDSNATYYAIWEVTPEPVVLGDVNGDGFVDAGDAVLISRYDAGFITLTVEQLEAGDVNGDGFVDAGDAVVISRYDAGFISSLN